MSGESEEKLILDGYKPPSLHYLDQTEDARNGILELVMSAVANSPDKDPIMVVAENSNVARRDIDLGFQELIDNQTLIISNGNYGLSFD
jgi:hypothetical protein